MSNSAQDSVTQRAQARIGQTLRAKWRLDRLLGVGGMAAVYAATHRNGKRGAVKMLHLELSIDEDAKSRFLREGYVANKVDHPGAVSVQDDDAAEDGSVFLVMELLEGQSVDARAKEQPGGKLPVHEVVSFADQLLDVLVSAHEKGIVHRDLKPENLFVSKLGHIKVLDFGIARLREISGGSQATRTGSVMGTPAFMPPEQALGNWNQIDGRTDLWATGATMFRLLSGRDVHEAENVNKLLLAAMTRHAPPVASVAPGVPPQLAAIVDRALAFEVVQRWPDARSMQSALRAFAASAGIPVGQVAPPPSSLPVGGFGVPQTGHGSQPQSMPVAQPQAVPAAQPQAMAAPQPMAPHGSRPQSMQGMQAVHPQVAYAPQPQPQAAYAPQPQIAPQRAYAPQPQVAPQHAHAPQPQVAHAPQPQAVRAAAPQAVPAYAPSTLPSASAAVPTAPVASHATSAPVTSDPRRAAPPGKSSRLGLILGGVVAVGVIGAVAVVLAMRSGDGGAAASGSASASNAATTTAEAAPPASDAPPASASATATVQASASATSATATATATVQPSASASVSVSATGASTQAAPRGTASAAASPGASSATTKPTATAKATAKPKDAFDKF